ncbi:MAG: lysylphosphatidylglycerol synthase transmembrane domain-containing protein [Myxococcota bacterium]
MRRRLRALVGVLVTAGLLALVLAAVDLQAVGRQLAHASRGWLVLAALLGPLQIGLSALRWRIVAHRLGLPLSLWSAVAEYGLSTLLNMLLPGGVAGDAVRVWRHRRQGQVSTGDALRAAVLERGVGQVTLALVALPGVALWTVLHPGVSRPPGAMLVVVAVAVGLVFAGASLGGDARRALMHPAIWGISAIITGSYLLAMALCARAIGAPLGGAAITAAPLILLAMAVPASIGGWGLREASAALLLPRLGWTPEEALTISALYGLTALLGATPGGLTPLWERTLDG